ncbi:MAG: hypothetical protein IPK81_24830 [Rhodospirillales bacterium]|nr:MAG: hypothetical protein IPK81_24830 [Rhodospirillales bacterium]
MALAATCHAQGHRPADEPPTPTCAVELTGGGCMYLVPAYPDDGKRVRFEFADRAVDLPRAFLFGGVQSRHPNGTLRSAALRAYIVPRARNLPNEVIEEMVKWQRARSLSWPHYLGIFVESEPWPRVWKVSEWLAFQASHSHFGPPRCTGFGLLEVDAFTVSVAGERDVAPRRRYYFPGSCAAPAPAIDAGARLIELSCDIEDANSAFSSSACTLEYNHEGRRTRIGMPRHLLPHWSAVKGAVDAIFKERR